MKRDVAIIIYPGFQLLDAAGPIAAFDLAMRYYSKDAYRITTLAPEAGMVTSMSGVQLVAQAFHARAWDTIVVVGGEYEVQLEQTRAVANWVAAAAPTARRIASVCTGAFILAEAGLLNDRRATTHWMVKDDFAGRYPKVKLDVERIFTRDGTIWTSAGITAGIDLALALIEEDLGAAVARGVAQNVVHHRRPGGQLQFSALLDMGGRSGRFAELMDWMRDHLTEPLTIEELAGKAAMSPRNFARSFAEEVGTTPAKAVERIRVEAARTAIETTQDPIDRIAEDVGFGDSERMRRAFVRAFGQPPQVLRQEARY